VVGCGAYFGQIAAASTRRDLVRSAALLGAVDRVGYLAADLDRAVADFVELFAIPVVRRFERSEYSLVGAYLGHGHGNIEVFSFSDSQPVERRLNGTHLALDHVAYEVADIDASAATMRAAGARFCGPDFREELFEPVELSRVLHLWTIPETTHGQSIQLLQRTHPAV
jgi:catechol 2,3-dioxygenase-like lactoylglutathione lyase family enzyme